MTTAACADRCTGAAIAATCSSASSCATGEVCCASIALGMGGGMASASCQTSCENPDAGRGIAIQICTTNAECPTGDTCRADVLGLDVCVPAPPVFDRDAGVFNRDAGLGGLFDGGIFRFDAGFPAFPDAGVRRGARDAGRD
jgi:hypothetical protein